MSILTPVIQYVDALVHPSARTDALTAARHRAFIAPRLIGSFVVLAALPVYLILRGVPSGIECAVLAWLVVPILLVCFLSRTGRYEDTHALSSLALTSLVTIVAAQTGGIGSFAATWLVLVPVEASLSASRRVVILAAMLALGGAAALLLLTAVHLLPPSAGGNNMIGAAAGLIAAVLYAAGLAFCTDFLARVGSGLFHAEEDRFRLLAHNMSDVLARHGRHGSVLFVSPTAEAMFGTSVRELLGHGLFDRVHVVDRPAYLKALSDAASSGEEQSVEFRVKRPTASAAVHQYLWIEMRCRPLERGAGDPPTQAPEVVTVMRDITDRKDQEWALDQARAEAERANAAKGRFLANVSHELRTPLNIIIGFSEMLTKDGVITLDAARRREYAALIHESGSHLLSVVNGILDMSKIESGTFDIMPESFAIAPAIAVCCDLLALKASEAGVTLTRRVASDLPDVVADRRALNQVLLNLLSNAIKFTDRNGKVTVGALRDGDKIAIIVEDTGVGIGADDLPHLGDPFFQARSSYDRRHDGTGLGLSIVKGLVELHGGEFTINSRLGEGTKVTVRLPIDCDAMKRPAGAAVEVIERARPPAVTAPVRRIA